MLAQIKNLSIIRSFILLACVASLFLLTVTGYTLYRVRYEMLVQKQREIAHTVEMAQTIIRGFEDKADKGYLSDDQAKQQMLETLGNVRFDTNNYFFIYDLNGVRILHPDKVTIGKNFTDVPDAKGRFYTREFIKAAKTGGGYVSYHFVRPGEKQASPKISYILPIERWNWLVGAGLYVEDVEGMTLTFVLEIAKFFVPLALIFAGLFFVILRNFSQLLPGLAKDAKNLAEGDLNTIVKSQERKDQIGALARAIQIFKDNALRLRKAEAEKQQMEEAAVAERKLNEARQAKAAENLAFVVKTIGTGLDQLREGNLTFQIRDGFDDAYEKLKDDFNLAMTQMQRTLEGIIFNSGEIHLNSGRIAGGAAELSERTMQQAASLEETSTAISEIASMVKQSAGNAKHARDVVANTKSSADASGSIVRQAIEAMGGIENSSLQISQIIGVIDEIAFQTSLLALNAGVEAARAGEAGKGFAVVASEVRALAQRSADAAKEIKELIANSRDRVKHGVDLVGETGQALKRIVDDVSQINELVSSISKSAEAQSSALDQVTSAMARLDEVTQRNSLMVEDSNTASRELAFQAGKMAKLIECFQVDGYSLENRKRAA